MSSTGRRNANGFFNQGVRLTDSQLHHALLRAILRMDDEGRATAAILSKQSARLTDTELRDTLF